MTSGRYDFGEWSVNELARVLREKKNGDAAIAMLEMNAGYYPKSADIDFELGELYRERGDTEKAVARYKMALEKEPKFSRARRRLEELSQK